MKRHCFFAQFDEQFHLFFQSLVKAACTEEYLWYRGIIFNIGDACTSIRFVQREVFIVFHTFCPMFSLVARPIMLCIVCDFFETRIWRKVSENSPNQCLTNAT